MSDKRPIMRNDPGNAFSQKPVSVRLQNIYNQWINLGDKQRSILASIIISAEALEDYVREIEDSHHDISERR